MMDAKQVNLRHEALVIPDDMFPLVAPAVDDLIRLDLGDPGNLRSGNIPRPDRFQDMVQQRVVVEGIAETDHPGTIVFHDLNGAPEVGVVVVPVGTLEPLALAGFDILHANQKEVLVALYVPDEIIHSSSSEQDLFHTLWHNLCHNHAGWV